MKVERSLKILVPKSSQSKYLSSYEAMYLLYWRWTSHVIAGHVPEHKFSKKS